ncbi:MAG: T9SS type A sorting domain-containing protein [Ignavibacteriota bacterium]|nr:T9SS C-terminal target domain-containing protein [Ignavibacteriota bacterium]MCO6446439.1 T9SS type A sorting domain-containing protein [Ignavibacterium album]QKK01124.1 MAG: T9SS type A sorting domain-containing protein [Ignavibacteriota bacterium]
MINDKVYYLVNGFFDFPNGTLIRYSKDSSQVIILKNDSEYIYMDFKLSDSSTMLQIQPNNTFRSITILLTTSVILGDTLNVKGFIRETVSPARYKKGWYYFAPDIGIVKQVETTNWYFVDTYSFNIIEYLNLDSLGNIYHKKHTYSADILFNPILLIEFGNNLNQNFLIKHPLSIKGDNIELFGRCYLDSVYLDSYYINDIDTIFNSRFPINSTSEIDYSLYYPVSSILYQQGYSLYYKIVAKDKGIVTSYYSRPTTGYYKLIYDPSPPQVLFLPDSIYVSTISDTGAVKIINTSDHSVRIDSINSVGGFYGYRGILSKPGFEYPFYLFQTMPGFMGDTLGIIIPPHDSINVSFYDVDLCPICDYEVQEYFKDTLRFVFTFIDGNVYSFSKSVPISGEGSPSAVEYEEILPKEFSLSQNYPNPFNPNTSIQYVIGSRQFVTLKVYDVLGNEVARLVNEDRSAGSYKINFDASNLSSGIYFYQLKTGKFIETKKMIYLR